MIAPRMVTSADRELIETRAERDMPVRAEVAERVLRIADENAAIVRQLVAMLPTVNIATPDGDQ